MQTEYKTESTEYANPLVSVIIPCYNCEKYVETAVRSIMEQTYQNMEIFVTDDCSTDGTYKILEKLSSEDKRIILIKNIENLKIIETLNNMIKITSGKYIARMDADDISLPTRIEKQVEFMESHPNYAICGTNALLINEYGRTIGRNSLPCSSEEIYNARFYLCPFYHPSIMVKTDILKNNKYSKKYIHIEDYALWIKILANHKGYNLNQCQIQYRIHKEQITQNFKLASRGMLIELFSEYFTNHDNVLATLYIDNFFLEINNEKNNRLDNFLLNELRKITNIKGYNFFLYYKYLRYSIRTKKVVQFLKILTTGDIFVFLGKLFCYLVKKIIFSLIRL